MMIDQLDINMKKKQLSLLHCTQNIPWNYMPKCRILNNKTSKDDLEVYFLSKDFQNRTQKTLNHKE